MKRRGRYSYPQYRDRFSPEGRELLNIAKALVINAKNEEDRAIKAQELKRVLEYVRENHLRVDEEVHTGIQLCVCPMAGG